MSSIQRLIDDAKLFFDVSTEDWSSTANVTEHPIEDGSDLSDHIQALPQQVTVNGTVSATPFVGNAEDLELHRLEKAHIFLRSLQPRNQPNTRYRYAPTLVHFYSDRYDDLPDMAVVSIQFGVVAARELKASITLRSVEYATSGTAQVAAIVPRADVADDMTDEEEAGERSELVLDSLTSNLHDMSPWAADRSATANGESLNP